MEHVIVLIYLQGLQKSSDSLELLNLEKYFC